MFHNLKHILLNNYNIISRNCLLVKTVYTNNNLIHVEKQFHILEMLLKVYAGVYR